MDDNLKGVYAKQLKDSATILIEHYHDDSVEISVNGGGHAYIVATDILDVAARLQGKNFIGSKEMTSQ